MYNYVILDDNQICTAICQTTDVVFCSCSMAVDDYDPSLIGQQWTGTEWEPPAVELRMGTVSALTPGEFMSRFSAAERAALRASADATVQDFLFLLSFAQEVSTADAGIIASVEYLEQESLIDTGRAEEILA